MPTLCIHSTGKAPSSTTSAACMENLSPLQPCCWPQASQASTTSAPPPPPVDTASALPLPSFPYSRPEHVATATPASNPHSKATTSTAAWALPSNSARTTTAGTSLLLKIPLSECSPRDRLMTEYQSNNLESTESSKMDTRFNLDLSDVFTFIDNHREEFLARLVDYLRHPSISAHCTGIADVAQYIAAVMK